MPGDDLDLEGLVDLEVHGDEVAGHVEASDVVIFVYFLLVFNLSIVLKRPILSYVLELVLVVDSPPPYFNLEVSEGRHLLKQHCFLEPP